MRKMNGFLTMQRLILTKICFYGCTVQVTHRKPGWVSEARLGRGSCNLLRNQLLSFSGYKLRLEALVASSKEF